jgi:hypothetical protein
MNQLIGAELLLKCLVAEGVKSSAGSSGRLRGFTAEPGGFYFARVNIVEYVD